MKGRNWESEVVLFVLAIGLIITVIAFTPNRAIQIVYISNISILLFSFTYVVVKRWYVAIISPVTLVLLYFFFWDSLLIFNVCAAILACIITIYLNALLSWKTILVFAALMTVLDVFQVFGTGFMGQAAAKVFALRLPVLIVLPTYPTDGFIGLGLGDVILAGLLSLQTILRLGRRVGTLTTLTISCAMFVFELVAFNTEYFTYFPATVVVLSGWLIGIGVAKFIGTSKIRFRI